MTHKEDAGAEHWQRCGTCGMEEIVPQEDDGGEEQYWRCWTCGMEWPIQRKDMGDGKKQAASPPLPQRGL